jgi:hypothetical protein
MLFAFYKKALVRKSISTFSGQLLAVDATPWFQAGMEANAENVRDGTAKIDRQAQIVFFLFVVYSSTHTGN